MASTKSDLPISACTPAPSSRESSSSSSSSSSLLHYNNIMLNNMYASFSQAEDDDEDDVDSLYSSYHSRFKLKHKPDKISLISTKLPMSDEEEDVKRPANADSDLNSAEPLIEDESDEFYADSGLIDIIKDANAKAAPGGSSLLVDTMGVGAGGSCASSSGVSSLPSSSASSCSSSSCSSVCSASLAKKKRPKLGDLSATSRAKKVRVEQSLMASLAKQMVEFEPSSRAPSVASDVQMQLKVLCTGEY